MHIFCPGRALHVDYSAETISLVGGGSEDRLDVLVTNHSQEPVDRVHVVYPHPLPPTWRKFWEHGGLYDATDTWLEPASRFNRFFRPDELRVTPKPTPPGSVPVEYDVTIKVPDPNVIGGIVPYDGRIMVGQKITPYQVGDNESRLNRLEWELLTRLGWSVFTIHFDHPLAYLQARWLRLCGVNGIIQTNRLIPPERAVRKMLTIHRDIFEIAGPLDVKHRLVDYLLAARLLLAQPKYKSPFGLLGLQDKLLNRGINAPSSETVYKDWRINVFPKGYRLAHEPSFWGDIQPIGALINRIKDREGRSETVIQWKAGERNVTPQFKGFFYARVRATDIPLIIYALSWLAVVATLFAESYNRLLVVFVLLTLVAVCCWRKKPKLWPKG